MLHSGIDTPAACTESHDSRQPRSQPPAAFTSQAAPQSRRRRIAAEDISAIFASFDPIIDNIFFSRFRIFSVLSIDGHISAEWTRRYRLFLASRPPMFPPRRSLNDTPISPQISRHAAATPLMFYACRYHRR